MPKSVLSQPLTEYGFTLVEILVVLAITAMLAVGAFANFSGFKEDQNLQNAALDLENIIRLAQTNATSTVKCNGVGDASWAVSIETNRTDINLKCSTSSASIKLLQLKGIIVDSISGSCASSFTSTSVANPIIIGFSTPYGTTSFQDSSSACITNSSSLSLTLKNLKTGNTKTITIDKGGGIN